MNFGPQNHTHTKLHERWTTASVYVCCFQRNFVSKWLCVNVPFSFAPLHILFRDFKLDFRNATPSIGCCDWTVFISQIFGMRFDKSLIMLLEWDEERNKERRNEWEIHKIRFPLCCNKCISLNETIFMICFRFSIHEMHTEYAFLWRERLKTSSLCMQSVQLKWMYFVFRVYL